MSLTTPDVGDTLNSSVNLDGQSWGGQEATTMRFRAHLRRSFPTFCLLARPFEWLGRSRRRVRVAALVALALVAGPPLWWATQLVGLPDIGDPFDVAAFRAMAIPVE